ncbi:hypothetical protein PIB30_087878 [Stylosanthes scabra]|uniref:F-box domain-containing protein n=1 Tax=Stylosanthes scabra TaxID=79078 RepID=A0ABU6RUF1_9FABA|nr:hypothetical protein [Stylosanthes scabra]
MMRSEEDDAVAWKGQVVTTTGGWPQLLRCTTTKPPPPILLDELIGEIHLRIPATSLLRLRNSVCTLWRTLIFSSQFANDNLRHLMALDVDRALTHIRVAYYGIAESYPKPIIS